MNESIRTIMTRRSTRSFKAKPIPREMLEQIVDAGRHAPSGRNVQPWQFTVVQNKETIKKLAKSIGKALGNSAYDFYSPDTLIIVSCEEDSPLGIYDASCALENIFLAAHALGIGSVWINQVGAFCRDSGVREVLTQIGVPENHIVHGTAALGYAASSTPIRNMKENTVKWVL